MHQYLDAIGFKNTFQRENEIELLLDNLFHSYDSRQAAREETPGCAFLEMSKSFGPGMGVRLCGQMDSQGFHRMFYFPYLEKTGSSILENVHIDLKGNGNGFCGMTEDGRAGLSIIFYLQNPALFKKRSFRGILSQSKVSIALTGLSLGGTIILGHKPVREADELLRKEDEKERFSLVNAAKSGNQDAIESLTMEDMDTYAMLSRRIGREDIYSIIETTFMPCGMECDQYRILGTILFYAKVRNTLTRQYIYQLTVNCNGIPIDICINERDLLGDPEIGRRFKGTIWLQGKLNLDGEDESGKR